MKVKVTQLCLTLCNPMDSPWNSPGQNTGVGSLIPSPGSLPNPGIEPRSPVLQTDSLPADSQYGAITILNNYSISITVICFLSDLGKLAANGEF